jgi:hypothetical protein
MIKKEGLMIIIFKDGEANAKFCESLEVSKNPRVVRFEGASKLLHITYI